MITIIIIIIIIIIHSDAPEDGRKRDQQKIVFFFIRGLCIREARATYKNHLCLAVTTHQSPRTVVVCVSAAD